MRDASKEDASKNRTTQQEQARHQLVRKKQWDFGIVPISLRCLEGDFDIVRLDDVTEVRADVPPQVAAAVRPSLAAQASKVLR